MHGFSFVLICTSPVQGRSHGGCPRCPGTPLDKKCLEGGTGIKNTIHRVKDFLHWRALPLENSWLRPCYLKRKIFDTTIEITIDPDCHSYQTSVCFRFSIHLAKFLYFNIDECFHYTN